jgi:hypothetical protein
MGLPQRASRPLGREGVGLVLGLAGADAESPGGTVLRRCIN